MTFLQLKHELYALEGLLSVWCDDEGIHFEYDNDSTHSSLDWDEKEAQAICYEIGNLISLHPESMHHIIRVRS